MKFLFFRSVLQILSDTLGGTQNPDELSPSVAFVPLKDSKYASVPVSDDARSAFSNNSDPNFNPGDKLCIETETSFKRKEAKKSREKIKDCHLRTVVGSALRCLKQLSVVKQGLVSLVASDASHSQTQRKHAHGTEKPDYQLISLLGEYTMYLSRQVFIPAHRLYTTALGLHMSEDLIRNPKDPALLNFKNGPVVRPDWNSIIHTQMKLRTCVDSATEMYHRFGREAMTAGKNKNQNEKLQHLMVTLMHAFQDLYATALGSNDIFKVLLHIEDYGEEILQEYLLSLKSNERTDLLVQVQTLRRSFDDIVIMVEQLSWTAYAVYRLALEKSLIPPSEEPSLSNIPLPPRLTQNVDENGNLIEDQSSSSSRRKSKERSRETSHKSRSRPSEEGSSYLEALKDPSSDGGSSSRRRSRSQSSRRDIITSDSEEQLRGKSSEGRSSSRKSRIPTPTSSPPTSSHRSSRTNVKDRSPVESDGYSSQLCTKSSKSNHRAYSTKEGSAPKSAEKSRNRSSSRASVSSKDSTSSVRSDNNKDSHHHSRSKASKADEDRPNKRRDREGSSSGKSSKSRQP